MLATNDEIMVRRGIHFHSKSDTILGYSDDRLNGTPNLAKCCLVLQIVGLTATWQHNIGFFLESSTFKADKIESIMKSSISLLEKEGLNVMGVTTEQGCNFEHLFKRLGVTESSPNFEIDSTSYHVYRVAPHLLKRPRNYILKHNGNVPNVDGQASWRHIEDLLKIVELVSLRIAPKLKKKCLWLEFCIKNEGKLCLPCDVKHCRSQSPDIG